jgi:hypothetical protein
MCGVRVASLFLLYPAGVCITGVRMGHHYYEEAYHLQASSVFGLHAALCWLYPAGVCITGFGLGFCLSEPANCPPDDHDGDHAWHVFTNMHLPGLPLAARSILYDPVNGPA